MRAEQTIEDAIAFGDASPEPSIAHLTDDVYSDEPAVLADPEHVLPAWIRDNVRARTRRSTPSPAQREITYSEALREAMAPGAGQRPPGLPDGRRHRRVRRRLRRDARA